MAPASSSDWLSTGLLTIRGGHWRRQVILHRRWGGEVEEEPSGRGPFAARIPDLPMGPAREFANRPSGYFSIFFVRRGDVLFRDAVFGNGVVVSQTHGDLLEQLRQLISFAAR